MPLREAVAFLKGAVARSLPGGAPSIYTFDGGVMFASSPAVLAAYPVAHIQGNFGLAADDLEGAISRMPVEPAISAGDGTLILKAGRLRSTIDLFAAEPPAEDEREARGNAEWRPCPARLWPAMAQAQPFVAKDGTWQKTVCLQPGRMLAVSNVSGAEVLCEGLELLGPQAGLVDDCADYLAKLPPPERWLEEPRSALRFSWPSGAWVRCRLAAAEWSLDDEGRCILDKVLDQVEADQAPLVQITAEWREAFADVAALGDGDCFLGPDGMVGKSAHAEHVAEFATGVQKSTRWGIKALESVLAAAAEWRPDAAGAALWRGANIRGAIIGKSS